MATSAITANEKIMARRLASLISGGAGDGEPITQKQADDFIRELAEVVDMDDLSSTAVSLGADLVGLYDVGGIVTATTAGAAIIENRTALDVAEASLATAETNIATQATHRNTTQAVVQIPMGNNWYEVDGTPLVAFADGVTNTPGLALDGSEAAGIRWNDSATPDPICTSVLLPYDLDDSANVILNVLAHKTGATIGDAVTWVVTAFTNADAALYDADADLGGTSSAMTGDAATKTSQLETLTLAAANIPAAPAMLTLTIQPTDGTLGTDDVTITGMWLTYTRKTLTS